MNNIAKLLCSTVASLSLGSTSYAQYSQNQNNNNHNRTYCCPFEQGFSASGEFPCAYNAPARIEVRSCWDLFVKASFLYWYAAPVAMELGTYVGTTATNINPRRGPVVFPLFSYQPGFKVGLGFNLEHDRWVTYAEYTRFRGGGDRLNVSKADTDIRGVILSSNLMPIQGFNMDALTARWKVGLDLVDLSLSRPYYQGYSLTVSPCLALRALWLRQALTATGRLTGQLPPNPGRVDLRAQTQFWSIGPKMGLQTNFLLGWGLRLVGDAGGSLLFTRYTKNRNQVYLSQTPTSGDLLLSVSNGLFAFGSYNTMTPAVDMGIGLGWGSYFDRQNYFFDLEARYDFMNLFQTNYIDSLSDGIVRTETTTPVQISAGSGEPASLHIHGLTLTARFDF